MRGLGMQSTYPMSSSPLMSAPSRIPGITPAIAGMSPYASSGFPQFPGVANTYPASPYPSSPSFAPMAPQANGVQRAYSSPSLAAYGGPRSSYFATGSAPSSDATVAYSAAPGGSLLGAIPNQTPPMTVALAGPRTSRVEASVGLSPRGYPEQYAIVTADDVSGLGHSSALATLSVDSPRRRKKAARAQRLYDDAVARRQRLQDMKDEAEKAEKDGLEEVKRDALLQQRARQRFYRFRDTRTHIEREEAILKRREDHRRELRREQKIKEQEQYAECTFQPKIFTKKEDREAVGRGRRITTGTHQVIRSSSCEAAFDRTPMLQDYYLHTPAPLQSPGASKLDSAGGAKLQIYLDKQLGYIRKLGKNDEEAHMYRQSRAQAGATEEEIRDTEVRYYKQQLDIVHSLERLDMEVLELPKVQLDALLAKGFRLGLGEGARQGLKSPREAARRAAAETPRNNLRVGRSVDMIREGQEFVNGATLTTYG